MSSTAPTPAAAVTKMAPLRASEAPRLTSPPGGVVVLQDIEATVTPELPVVTRIEEVALMAGPGDSSGKP